MLTVYLTVIVLSIIVSIFLVNLARSSSKGRVGVNPDGHLNAASIDIEASNDFRHVVSKEISGLVDSKQLNQQIANKVTEVYSRELEQKINRVTQELDKKHNAVLKEKSQSEEIAWGKYNKVLSDKRSTEAVIRSVAEGLVVVDSEGKVILMNPAAEKMLSVSKKDKIGKPIANNMANEYLVSLVKDPGKQEEKEIELVSGQDETKKILRASSAVIENENGQTVGMVSVLSDVTKQKELDELKSQFVANVTHELRTPLVAIDKSIVLLLNGTMGGLPDNQKEALEITQRNIKRLSALINNLLDLSKLEAGQYQLSAKAASIEKIIDDALATLNSWALSKSIHLEKRVEDDLPEVNVDSDKILQVLINLVGNSIKFTPTRGSIFVTARKLNDKEVEVRVKDTGAGIAKEYLGRIFDKFFQAGERNGSDINGTGIGLSIVKELVSLHGGAIRAESQPNEGATFIFTLPIV